jgi:sulfate adenylyltransferase (ADP) / ATP adenylyltransferase
LLSSRDPRAHRTMEHFRLHPGTLWPAVLRQTAHALRLGALRPIETIQTLLEEGGVRFLVRQVASLARKEETRQAREVEVGAGSAVNPFLTTPTSLWPSSRTLTSPCSTSSTSSTIIS